MMDGPTLAAYEAGAASFAKDWHEQPPPSDLHALVRRYFHAGGRTADIGCGSGREVAFFTANGFDATGYDASEGLLREARARYPDLKFATALFPDLAGVPVGAFDNALCETVIMHLPRAQIAPSVGRLLSILRPGGVLYVSWRVTEVADRRDPLGRLYSAFDAQLVRRALSGAEPLLDDEPISASSGMKIHRIVVRR